MPDERKSKRKPKEKDCNRKVPLLQLSMRKGAARGMCRNLWTHRTKLLADYKPFQWALRVRFRGNEARSDHDLVVSLAI
jgi:hypothetical protein